MIYFISIKVRWTVFCGG